MTGFIFGRWELSRLATAGVLFILGCWPMACQAERGRQVEWQNVAVTLKPESHLLEGESTVIYSPGTPRVSLRLSERARIIKVEAAGKTTTYSFSGGRLSVELPAAAGERVEVSVSYSGTFNDAVSRHPAASEDPSYGVNGAITREGSFLGDGSYWYPVPEQVPLRRSLSVSAPAGVEAIGYGRRVSRETVGSVTKSVWEEARPVGVMSLCAGYYRIEERKVKGIDLYSYLYPGNAALATRYLDAAEKYLAFYSDLFGPYPFEKFAVVENFFPTGYGFPSFTLLGGSVIRLPFIVDTSFPHEIAHSWWGNGVQIDPREGNWCEGLVTYLADYLLKERRSAAEGRDYRRQLLIDYASLVTPGNDFPVTSFESRSDPSSRAIGYGKAAMIFHMVRSRIGDAAFFEALRQVAREHMYRAASWSDLVRAFSQSSGQDQGPFMKQWLTRSGGPRLSLAEVTSRREGKGWTVSGVILQNTAQGSPEYQAGLPVRVETPAGQAVEKVVQLGGARTAFTVSTDKAPSRVILDPEVNLFRVLAQEEIPPTVNSLKGSTRLTGVMTGNCRATAETFKNLLASLSQEGAPIVGEGEIEQGKGGDLIFCGIPQDKKLLPRLPRELELSQQQFAVEGEPYGGPDSLLLAVLPRPGEPGRVSAVFLPLSAAAGERYAGKITHYGKYGYLVFAEGANRRKGTAASTGGGAAVDLHP